MDSLIRGYSYGRHLHHERANVTCLLNETADVLS